MTMSGSEGSSDGGFSSSDSRFEPSRTPLESYEEEMLSDSHDHQACLPSDEEAGEERRSRDRGLDIVASTSHVSVVEEGVLDAIPIFRPEFMADHFDMNLLDNRHQLETLRESCCIPESGVMRLVHDEELPMQGRGAVSVASVVAKDDCPHGVHA
ncbi:hypothetical protein C1H46_035300 [Malus baccata]|uniref:Uncharacterized protein n=1 Tax=Malus baccata TaxID=106549 RepID=A0A540KY43_MALBA|nr:hypothetical protein C1H46_035300 [Malus baccata]